MEEKKGRQRHGCIDVYTTKLMEGRGKEKKKKQG